MQNFDDWAVGPGSYNLSNDISSKSFIYHNAPRPLFSRSRKLTKDNSISSQNNTYQTLNPPEPSSPTDRKLLRRSSSGIKFCKSKRTDYFSSASRRSPGPIYSYSLKSSKGCSFTKEKKLEKAELKSPGPGSYSPKKSGSKIAIKLKGPSSVKLYLKNFEKYYKGQLGPGPGGYCTPGSLKKGIVIAKSIKESDKLIRNFSPGPGSYNLIDPNGWKTGHKFPESRKRLDIRACNLYLDRNSFEFFK